MRSDEELLTGTDAERVTAAALAEYPGGTIQRVETDSDGVYEAHLVTADGQVLVVQLDEQFAVTGTDTHGGGGRGGHITARATTATRARTARRPADPSRRPPRPPGWAHPCQPLVGTGRPCANRVGTGGPCANRAGRAAGSGARSG